MTWKLVPKAHNAPPTPHSSTKHETVKISNGRSDSFSFLKFKIYPYIYYSLKGVILTQLILASPSPMKDVFSVSTFTVH